jgi:sulfite dehydrogenase
VDWLSLESTNTPGIHVLGDAIFPAPTMPKSGHMANQHGKLAAAAIIELMNGRQPSGAPIVANTCYSFVSDKEVIHVASVHRYDAAQKTMVTVPGSGGVSSQRSELEGSYAAAWAQNIWSDTLG